MLHSLFCLETAVYVLGVTTTHHQERRQLSTVFGICHTVTSSNGVTNTRCCRYSRLRSWW
jgi:hypothetical protein